MTRWSEGGDELAVELLDEPPRRPPRRWAQLALLLGAVVVVVGVGMLDDGNDETSLPPTTTTTTIVKRTTTTRRVHRITTTTSLPRFEPGTRALLPGGGGTSLVTLTNDGLVTVADLATGALCIDDARRPDAWMPFRSVAMTGAVPLQTDRGLALVDSRCTVRELPSRYGGYAVAMAEDAVWFMTEDAHLLSEVRIDGSPGRSVELPGNVDASVLPVGRRLVLGVAGSMTLIDPDTGRRRDLGAGTPVASIESTVAVVTCPKLTCALSLLDVDTGRRRPIGGPALAETGFALFSPNGRYLAMTTMSGGSVLVDVTTKAVAMVDAEGILGFTAGSNWLLAQAGEQIVAVRSDGSNRRVVTSALGANGIAVLFADDY